MPRLSATSRTLAGIGLTAPAAVLYAFTTFTFTNGSTVGRIGVTKATLLTSYNTTTYPWLNNTAYFDMHGTYTGYQLWTVPQTGVYTIQATGASGGNGATKGAPARVSGNISLTSGQKLWICCGQRAGSTEAGDGGTWVCLSNNGNLAGSTALFVAGGAGDYSYYTNEPGYQTGQSFSNAQTTDGIDVTVLNASTLNPTTPTTGNGGTINDGSATANPSGGGGFNTDGNVYPAGYQGFGRSFFNGLYGGMYQATVFDTTTTTGGGFGGAGSRNAGYGTGGGGGYTGGCATGSSSGLRRSTGGSSYIIPSATSQSRVLVGASAPSATLTEGSVIITKV